MAMMCFVAIGLALCTKIPKQILQVSDNKKQKIYNSRSM